MAIKTIMFDLDGTLLPMDQEIFVKEYMTALAAKMSQCGFEPQKFMQAMFKCVMAMVKNDGKKTNEQVFWDNFVGIYGDKVSESSDIITDFYKTEFQQLKNSCGFNPKAKEIIEFCKDKGLKIVLATNPLFPSIATESRMTWAGVDKSDFEYYTVYENSSYCKPNPAYYTEIMTKLDLKPCECAMVGNDVTEDMVAAELGINVFLLTDNIINRNNKDISVYPHGSFEQLKKWIEENI